MTNRLKSPGIDMKEISEVPVDTSVINNNTFSCDQCVSGEQEDGLYAGVSSQFRYVEPLK